MTPQVSVVMPVRNTLPYLSDAIESILSQTFADFEFLIGDDASDDGSSDLIQKFCAADSRIRALRSDIHLGPAQSSAWVAEAATAPLVARMDADDICHPERLHLQVAAFRAHPDTVLVASLLQMIDRRGSVIRGADYSVLTKGAELSAPHPSIMYRREAYWAVGGYQPETDYFEDRILVERLRSQGDTLFIAAPLHSYRMCGTSARLSDDQTQVEESLNRQGPGAGTGEDDGTVKRRISPAVYKSLGSLRLWSYQPPRILVPMIRRMRLRPLRPAVTMFFWAAVVTMMPSLARGGSRLLFAWRNWRIRRHVLPNHLYRWRADAWPEDLGSAGF